MKRSFVALLTAAVAVLGLSAGVATTAHAIPGDGAGPDTPGTSSSVSPRQLSAGQTLSFTVSGFPAGETIYIKIDDGQTCSAASVHGACVVHQQVIGANGTVSGSFVLPGDLGAGTHWLRFLASEEVTNAQGGYGGTKGYTLRGGSDFTVTRGQGSGPAASGGDAAQEPTGDAVVDAGPAVTAAGGITVVRVPKSSVAAKTRAKDGAETVPGSDLDSEAEGTETEPTTEPEPEPAAEAASEETSSSVPVVGLVVLALCVLAAGLLWGRRRRHA